MAAPLSDTSRNACCSEAAASLQQALRLVSESGAAIPPRYADAYCNLGNVHKDMGRVGEAIECYRQALTIRPDDHGVHSNLLFALNYHPDWTPQAIFEEHRCWGNNYVPRADEAVVHANTPDPERRLKIGYVSPDLRNHSVAFFLEPVLENHDIQKFEVHTYAEVSLPDATTARLREQVAHWRDTVGIPDEQLARQIRDDGIDILVDLAGHTAGNRLGVFAFQPAPVQATYIGYPNTTGLPAMDYRITNALTTPPELDRYFTESVVRLPFANCFAHPADCPPVAAPPMLTSGRVTFGSFNNLAKLVPPVIALWAEVLRAVPGARLLLKSQPFGDAGARALFLDRFAAHGIGPERLVLRGAGPLQEYLRSFNDIDIALDPFPYNGSTTNYHALWMGVPVVTLEGRSAASRMGYGVLATLGLKELAAKTPAEYVAIATGLAADPDRLKTLRASMRERMNASPLKDGRRHTAALEDLYRNMWRNWCNRDG